MSDKEKFDASLTTPRHWIAVAVIIACGMVGGALILRPPGGTPAAAPASAPDERDHDHEGEKKNPSGQPAKGKEEQGKDGDGHAHGEDEDHGKATAGTPDEHGDNHGDEEGVVKLSESQRKAAGLSLAKAEATSIREELLLPGEIRFDEDRTAHVVPRVSGVVQSVHAQLGQRVQKDQLLAVISSAGISDLRSEQQAAQRRLALARTTYAREKQLWEERISAEQDYLQARQALQEAEIAAANAAQKLSAIGAASGSSNRYELRAPLAGVVVEKHLTTGEAVTESTASFTISDTSFVWAEMSVSAAQLPLVREGVKAVVRSTAFDSTADGKVAYVSALIGEQTRTATARVAVANPQNVWRPGLFVNVGVQARQRDVPVAVEVSAVQRLDDKGSVVFVPDHDGFRAVPVKTGLSDGRQVEITSGLEAGSEYVKDGAFMLKAELGKASAEHTH